MQLKELYIDIYSDDESMDIDGNYNQIMKWIEWNWIFDSSDSDGNYFQRV